MSKHTQGPWMIYDDGDGEDSSDIINVWIDDRDGGEKYDIAAMLLDRPVGERKANARLIASAPDLLEALENALADINWLLVEGFDTNADECNIDGVRDTIAEIKQAIAKAKGGE